MYLNLKKDTKMDFQDVMDLMAHAYKMSLKALDEINKGGINEEYEADLEKVRADCKQLGISLKKIKRYL
jgi:hypothetical protein